MQRQMAQVVITMILAISLETYYLNWTLLGVNNYAKGILEISLCIEIFGQSELLICHLER